MEVSLGKDADPKSQDLRQAANIALMEVDKGLRSNNVGEQCEAIMKFPNLINQFPFPVLINTAFLKLADVFWSGPNILREYVVQVTEQSKGHLCKVTDVEEVFRRISTVIFSNDPMARALTLSAFGSLASLVANQQKVLHSVYRGLDSHHQQEQEAAITATVALCQYSRNFAAGVCDKVVAMTQAVTTPMLQKLKLLPVLEHLYYDLETANKVRQVCIALLQAYPSKHFTVVLLQTLSKLAISTCAQIPDQIALLLKVSATDARSVVRLDALAQLKTIASSSANMWTESNIEALMNTLKKKKLTAEDVQLMDVVSILSYARIGAFLFPAYELILSTCTHVEPSIAARACKALCGVTFACKEGDIFQLDEVMCIAEALLCAHSQTMDAVSFKMLMSTFVNLARVNTLIEPSMLCIAESLMFLPGELAILCCWALTAIAAQSKAVSQRVAKRLLFALTNCSEKDKLLHPLSVVLMRMSVTEMGNCSAWHSQDVYCEDSLCQHIFSMTAANRYFVMYQIAREASHLGFYRLAYGMFLHVCEQVDSDSSRSWLNALVCIAKAECTMLESTNGFDQALSEGISLLQKAELYLQASNKECEFSRHFLSIRVKYVVTLTQLLTACTSCFPKMSNGKQNICTSLTSQFMQSFQAFEELALSYAKLYSLSFDADEASLEYLKLLEVSCTAMQSLLGAALDKCGVTELSSLKCLKVDDRAQSTSQLSMAYSSFSAVQRISQDISDVVKLKHNSDEALVRKSLIILKEVAMYACTCSVSEINSKHESEHNNQLLAFYTVHKQLPHGVCGNEYPSQIMKFTKAILRMPCLLPQYFFSAEQRTNIRLVTVPSIPDANESISVSSSEKLSVTVEGVVEQKCPTGRYRKPKGVLVKINQDLKQPNNVTTKPHAAAFIKVHKQNCKKPGSFSHLTTKRKRVQGDYFQLQVLLTFEIPGKHLVQMHTFLVDDMGREWSSDANLSFLVHAL